MISFITKNFPYHKNTNISFAPLIQIESILCSQPSKAGSKAAVSHSQQSDSFQDRDECAVG